MISRRFTRMKTDLKVNDELSAKESAQEHEKLVSASALIRVHPRESAADLNVSKSGRQGAALQNFQQANADEACAPGGEGVAVWIFFREGAARGVGEVGH